MTIQGIVTIEKDAPDMTSRRSILELEKSQDPFQEQIEEACRILSINLKSLRPGHIIDTLTPMRQKQSYDIVLRAPSYKWTLNWLLKKLRAHNDTESTCLLPDAWLLLHFLIAHVSPAGMARLLTSNKYMEIIKNTLDQLRKHCSHMTSTASTLLASSKRNFTDSDSSQGYSSGAYNGSPSSRRSPHRTSRKRKRAEAERPTHERDVDSLDWTSTSFASISGTLRQIEYSLECHSSDMDSILTEQLRYILRCPLNDAANILGSSIYVLNHFGQRAQSSPVTSTEGRKYSGYWLDLATVEAHAKLFIDLWEKHACSAGNEGEESRHEAFTREGLIPCLLFLDTGRRSFNLGSPMSALVENLESLIKRNAILPMQKSDLTGVLVKAFLSFTFPEPSQPNIKKRQQLDTDNLLMTILLPSFFELAISASLEGVLAVSREDKTFLRGLFDTLKHCAKVKIGPASPDNLPVAYIRSLRFLLQKTADHNVLLENSTIESIVEENTGLFSGSTGRPIEWTIISLCLDNNADVFITPIGAPSGSYSYRKPNRFLISLLAALDGDSNKADDDQLYETKLKTILIPLVQAFARARDLPSFLEHWKEQLTASKKVSPSVAMEGAEKPEYRSLWKDDELLHAAQGLIEPSLSVSQLDEILAQVDDHLCKLDQNNEGCFSAAELVILDCILSGCHGEELCTKLSVRVRSIYRALTHALLGPSAAFRGQRWRVWRVLATIYRKWPSFDDGESSVDIARKIAQRAYEVVNKFSDETRGHLVDTYREMSHAFSVVITLASIDHQPSETTAFSSWDLLERLVDRLLDHWDSLWLESKYEVVEVSRPLKKTQSWSGKSVDIGSHETLLFSCIMQLLAQPSLITHLNANILQNLLGLFNRGACCEKPIAMNVLAKGVSYAKVWARLKSCEVLNEDVRVARALHKFQVERYLSFLDAKDPKYWEVESVEYVMAFESLQTTPLSKLEPEQRIDIANGLLDVLVLKKDLDLYNLAQHLQVLAKFVDTPKKSVKLKKSSKNGRQGQGKQPAASETQHGHANELIEKSMNVFRNIKTDDDPLQERSAILVLAERVFQRLPSDAILDCDDGLRRLTHIILDHVYATLSLDESTRYFTKLYQWIDGEIELASLTKPVTISSSISKSPMMIVTANVLNYYHKHCDQASRALGSHIDTTSNVRFRHFEMVLNLLSMEQYDEDLTSHHELAAILECLDGYSDLLGPHPKMGDVLGTLASRIFKFERAYEEGRLDDGFTESVGRKFALRARQRKLRIKLGDSLHKCLPRHKNIFDTLEELKEVLEEIKRTPNGPERSMLSKYFKEMTQTATTETIKRACIRVYPLNDNVDDYCGALTILRAILYNGKDEGIAKCPLEASNVFHVLCRAMIALSDFRESMLSLQCIALLLQRQPQIISQLHVDTVLSATAVSVHGLVSKHGSIYNDNIYVCNLYIGFCHLVATIFSSHRTKLGGRYHLLLPVLQSLLQQLYTPYASTGLSPAQGLGFNQSHARAYARLLTTFCDPSPSAVGRPTKRPKPTVNDEIKREKSIIGQHLHYLIMTYCECQLTGKLGEGMREALEPGLWAVLNCLGADVMRTVNAAMDSSGRAVWKRVYDDWKRFGQWHGE